jgi:GNAT superfamily N-acetyltransferase
MQLFFKPCDAKIPFSLPWLDRIERRIAATVGIGADSGDLQPYLSNLCVDENFRGKKIGRALVRCVEDVAKTSWGMSRIYLHVDEENIAALSLYCSEGKSTLQCVGFALGQPTQRCFSRIYGRWPSMETNVGRNCS